MLMKSGYILAASAALGLMLFEAPRGGVLTSAPDRGKVERQTATNTGPTKVGSVRHHVPMFIFIGGIHGGK